MTVFDLFAEQTVELLKIDRAGLRGNKVVAKYPRMGVLIESRSKTSENYADVAKSSSKLFLRPADLPDGEILDWGVRIGGRDYEIVNVETGRNFDTNEIEHYLLSLTAVDYVEG